MLFTIALVAILVIAVALLFAYQKIYNPGKLCSVCYRVVPEQALQCPFCDSDIDWEN
jgi:rRNA maturation endonuclease Nob1